MRIRILIGVAALFFLVCTSAQATHLRAGEITIQRVSCTGLTFNITITVYTNTGSEIRFGEGTLDFGDGSRPLTTPTIENTLRPDLGTNIGTVSFTTQHTYSGPGRYVVSYLEPNRNAGILNMFNSVDTRFYMESTVNIDPFLGCDNSPRLLVPPIDKACTGKAFYHNPGAYDPDGDSLSYEFTIPKRDKGLDVNNYRDPNAKEFYDRAAINYSTANEAKNGPPTFTINPIDGTIIWDSPGAQGEYNIAFIIREWRKVSGIWVDEGYVVRDMQIIVDGNCSNKRPELQVPPDICVEAGTTIHASIFGTDPDNDSVKIEAYAQILNQDLSHPFPFPASYIPLPIYYYPPPSTKSKEVFQATGPSKIAKVDFTWLTNCVHVKEQAYQVVFKITDKPAANKGTKLVQFKTWNIRVVGPAPKWKDAHLIPSTRNMYLEWKPYPCTNASTIQLFRRVDSFAYSPVQCVTGIPDYLGYTKIKEVASNEIKFTDTNLAAGAQYCYRLVAIFPLPGGGESYVSRDTCLVPIPAKAPIITNVTVDKTSVTVGKITVKWRSPYEADKIQFPRPFKFKVFRSTGFTGLSYVNPHTGTLTDSTYTDTDINTEELVYNYKIEAYDNNNALVDVSTIASSVRLEAKPEFKQIQLSWSFNVPWSNQVQAYPKHDIYRGKPGDTEAQFVFIGDINATSGKYMYTDSGQYNSTPLDEAKVYCYRVMTRGSYGNPKIPPPLLNYSQIGCAQPNDAVPPCQPELAIIATPCDQYISSQPCGANIYSNTITWKRPLDEACRQDIRSYNIYMANQIGSEFLLYVENVKDTFYIDANLPSFARCYKIAAVDRAGNTSDLSDSYCFDNCPNYELPNVFTPNGDKCNDLFSAFSGRQVVDENGNGQCGPVDETQTKLHCARFVENVVFTVVNRWGKDVYNYDSGGENNIYIDWDGKDDDGKDLAAGIYYYDAEVTFTVVDPKKKVRNYHGWVQIVR